MLDNFTGIEINKIHPTDPEDLRGPTYELYKGETGLQVTAYIRRRDVFFGNHYHRGEDPSKNPEKMFLVKGVVRLIAEDGVAKKYLDTIVKEGYEIRIYPNILHSMLALTDVIFLEYRSTIFDRENPDTYPNDTYEGYIKNLKNNYNCYP